MSRITFLLPRLTLNGGIRVASDYGRALLQQGHDVTFVCRTLPAPRFRDVLLGRAVFRLNDKGPMDYFVGIEENLRFFPANRPLQAEDLPDGDHLICTWWETVEWAQHMPARKGKVAHLMQGYEMFEWLPQDRVAATYTADTVKIAVSDWIAQKVQHHHGEGSAAVIHNAVDTAHFAYRPERDNSVFTVGFMYSDVSIKHPDLAFAVADRLTAQGIPVRLVSFGTCALAEEHSARSDTTFHHCPDQSDIPSLYQACDLWLFPSLEEGFGLPLLEALSCGTPVVSSHAGAAPQLIETGRNGYLCNPTPEDFVEAIVCYRALSSEQQAAMRRAARATVESWDWTKAARKLVEVLEAHPTAR